MDRSTDAPTRPAPGPDPGSPVGEPGPPRTPPEPVQRWRLRFAREPVPGDLVGRAAMDAWGETLRASGLPVAGLEPGGPGRARFVLGAPLPAGSSGRAELGDIWLLERRPLWAVREALETRMPPAHRFVGAEDVWLGAPPLPGQVVAADWSVSVEPPGPDPAALAAAVRAVLDAKRLPRVRARAGGDRAYDLRPLLISVDPGPADEAGRAGLRLTTRLDPALGTGRPEEVVAAVADALGAPIGIAAIIRDRFVLADPRREPAAARSPSPGRRPRR